MTTDSKAEISGSKKLLAAAFFGISSFLITVVNKIVLTSNRFPAVLFLAFCQMLFTIAALSILRLCKYVSFPDPSLSVIKKLWPLPLFYAGNLLFGLGGTKRISLPMFTALRRFSILFIMIGEFYILGTKPHRAVTFCVFLMILSAFVAAGDDLAFDAMGYSYIMANNFFTAANGVFSKQKLEIKEIGKYGVLFYNCALMFVPLAFLCYFNDEFNKAWLYDHWDNAYFLTNFLMSCVLGLVLNYATLLCTAWTSALTTSIVGPVKNIFVTYLGMVIGGDYTFSVLNFIGLNVGALASLLYTYVTFRKSQLAANKQQQTSLTKKATSPPPGISIPNTESPQVQV